MLIEANAHLNIQEKEVYIYIHAVIRCQVMYIHCTLCIAIGMHFVFKSSTLKLNIQLASYVIICATACMAYAPLV